MEITDFSETLGYIGKKIKAGTNKFLGDVVVLVLVVLVTLHIVTIYQRLDAFFEIRRLNIKLIFH